MAKDKEILDALKDDKWPIPRLMDIINEWYNRTMR